MPDIYTGNGAATQPPDGVTPGFDVNPKIDLPTGAEARNASSIRQALKALADFIGYLVGKVTDIFLGRRTIKTLTLDGVGNNAAGATAGALSLSVSKVGSSAPTPTFIRGEIFREGAPLGWAFVLNNGSISHGYGINAVVKNSTGFYTVTTNALAVSDLFGVVTPGATSAFYGVANSTSSNTIDVRIFNSAGSLADCPFMIWLFGD